MIWRWRLREVDDVEVDDADRADTGRGEIERGRRAETARADEQRLRVEQLGLAFGADLGDQQVAAVALLLLGGQDDRRVELEPGALPALEAARHRGDVRVAHLGEGLGGEQRADAAGAIEDDRGIAVGRGALDLLLDVALGDVEGAGQVALLPLGRLADVDDRGGARGEGVDLLRADFSDLGACLAEEVGVGLRHGWMGSGVRQAGRRGCQGGERGVRGVRWIGTSRRQAGARHLQRRSIRVMRRLRRGRRDAQVAEHVLEAVVAEHRALEAGRADVDAEQVEQVVRADGGHVVDRLALDLVGQQAGAGLADGAAAAGEGDAVHDPVLHAEHQRDPVPAQRVGALVRRVGVLDDPEVVGPPVVLEDVVAIEVVHVDLDYSANVQSRPYRSDIDSAVSGL